MRGPDVCFNIQFIPLTALLFKSFNVTMHTAVVPRCKTTKLDTTTQEIQQHITVFSTHKRLNIMVESSFKILSFQCCSLISQNASKSLFFSFFVGVCVLSCVLHLRANNWTEQLGVPLQFHSHIFLCRLFFHPPTFWSFLSLIFLPSPFLSFPSTPEPLLIYTSNAHLKASKPLFFFVLDRPRQSLAFQEMELAIVLRFFFLRLHLNSHKHLPAAVPEMINTLAENSTLAVRTCRLDGIWKSRVRGILKKGKKQNEQEVMAAKRERKKRRRMEVKRRQWRV